MHILQRTDEGLDMDWPEGVRRARDKNQMSHAISQHSGCT